MRLIDDLYTEKAVCKLIDYSFNKVSSVEKNEHFKSRYDNSYSYGLYVGSQLSSLVMNTKFKIKLFNEIIDMAGVGYVSSYPEYRGHGNINQLMNEMLTDAHKQGFIVSQLAPFSESFYKRFGYSFTIWQKQYEISFESFNLNSSNKNMVIKRGDWNEIKHDIIAFYNRFLNKTNQLGTVVREEWWWDRLNDYYEGRKYAVIYNLENEISGYIIYRIMNSKFVINELCYEDKESLGSLLNFVNAHSSSCMTCIYNAPMHENLECFFSEQQKLKIKTVPYLMSRIINFKKLIEKFSYLDLDIVLEVTSDEFCPWNIGRWKKIDKSTCIQTDYEPDISCSIQTWGMLLLGRLSLNEAIFLGEMKVTGRIKEDFFQKGIQSTYDYF